MALRKEKLASGCSCGECRRRDASGFILGLCVIGFVMLIVLAYGLRAAASL